MGPALDFGDSLDPELLHGSHPDSWPCRANSDFLTQHFLEESLLAADVSIWREPLLHVVQDLDDGAKTAELKRKNRT